MESKIVVQAVRSDGSSVQLSEIAAPNGNIVQQKAIVDLAQQQRVVVEGITKSISTFPFNADTVTGIRKGYAACLLDTSAERGTYAGYQVVKQIRERPSCENCEEAKKAALRSESWRAPALGCVEIRRITTMTQKGKTPMIVTDVAVEEILPGEPAASLFDIPAGYVERRPSEVAQELDRLKGIPSDPAADAVRDTPYRESRRPRSQ